MFKVGDNVVYPYHGAGTIQDIEEKNVLGETHSYFILHFPLVDVTLMLPETRIDQSGLRKVISSAEIENVAVALKNGPEIPPSTSQFSRDTENLLKSGSIIDAAHLVSSLSKKNKRNGQMVCTFKIVTICKKHDRCLLVSLSSSKTTLKRRLMNLLTQIYSKLQINNAS